MDASVDIVVSLRSVSDIHGVLCPVYDQLVSRPVYAGVLHRSGNPKTRTSLEVVGLETREDTLFDPDTADRVLGIKYYNVFDDAIQSICSCTSQAVKTSANDDEVDLFNHFICTVFRLSEEAWIHGRGRKPTLSAG